MLVYLFLAVHALLVFVTLVAHQKKSLHLDLFLLIFLVIFPIVGFIGVLIINHERNKADAAPEVDVEADMPWLFKKESRSKTSPQLETDFPHQYIVPFEEALLLNGSQIRRQLLMNLIYQNPEQYVSMLHQARFNDDVEVVHYATTILADLTKSNDEKLQSLQLAYHKEEIDADHYLKGLSDYISLGLAEGQYNLGLQDELMEVYARKQKAGDKMTIVDYKRMFEALSNLGRKDERRELIDRMEMDYAFDEETWILKLKLAIEERSSADLEALKQRLRESPVYFSVHNKEILDFWGIK